MAKQVYRARQAFVCLDADGVKRRFDASTLVSEGHWALKGREHMFEAAEDVADRDPVQSVTARPVEQATAEPGEKRSTRRPRKSADDADSTP